MDGEFTCPECGQIVKVRGLAPGRQARCSFCKRLLEVPFLPRAQGKWKRATLSRPRWVVWAWVGVGFVAVALLATAAMQLILSQERAARARTINRLIASSEAHEAAGRFDMALLDLDTALEYLPSARAADEHERQTLRDRRRSLAHRDVDALLERLDGRDAAALGDWLNLQARVGADHDLGNIQKDVRARFGATLHHWIDADEAEAQAAVRSRRPIVAVERCSAAAAIAIHLAPDDKQAVMRRLGAIVLPLIESRGAVIDRPAGDFVFGTEAGYDKALRPAMIKALDDKGYLPPAPNSPWRDDWKRAPYRLSISLHEHQEGNYLSTQNRLTRIEARVVFSRLGVEIWKTSPNAKTKVPLPSFPSFLSTRLALNSERLNDVEKLLYDNARDGIADRFKAALGGLPGCR
jgi:hypothetical protein